jgi:hypothetical protein
MPLRRGEESAGGDMRNIERKKEYQRANHKVLKYFLAVIYEIARIPLENTLTAQWSC